MAEKLFYKKMKSPIGKLTLIVSAKGLYAILWENDDLSKMKAQALLLDNQHKLLLKVEKQLSEYFEGKRKIFKLPLDFHGTEFQKEVWSALIEIPYGQTRSYKDIAQRINRPKAMRAVGAANGKNPISIIAPCHRVIGAKGDLVGFTGGLDYKKFLLDLEKKF